LILSQDQTLMLKLFAADSYETAAIFLNVIAC
jgi:hypothetical protein